MEIKNIKSIANCETFCEGCINDFESGIIEKAEFMDLLQEYTFWLIEFVREESMA